MAIFHGNAIPSASEPQVIAPSSNDWDYTLSTNNNWLTSGNALGDHTSGGTIINTSGHYGLSSLLTFDGDFEIAFDYVTNHESMFGVYAIDEDGTRDNGDTLNLHAMTNSFFYYDYGTQFYIGAVSEGSYTMVEPSSVVLARSSGTITVAVGGSVIQTFSSTYSGTVRFAMSGDGISAIKFENIFFTDSDKVQRDGFLNETLTVGQGVGNAAAYDYAGFLWVATRTGSITSVTINIATVNTAYTGGHWELWSHDGTNPASQIGSDSNSNAISSTGNSTITFSTEPSVVKGTHYWLVLVDEGSGSIDVSKHAAVSGVVMESARGDVITGLSAGLNVSSQVWRTEVAIDTSAGEPTPDHDTLLLVHCEGVDGNAEFTDSSQFNRVVTTVDGAHHDNVKAYFGSTSLYCDGTNDEITIPDSIDWTMPNKGHFTVDFWVYFNGTPANNTHICGQGTDNRTSYSFIFRCDVGGNFFAGTSNGSTGSSVTCSTNLSDAWHHVALVYDGVLKLYIDGTSEGTPVTHTNAILNVAYPWEFGGGNNSVSHINAWFEEIRISRVARWGANFTRPSLPYPTD